MNENINEKMTELQKVIKMKNIDEFEFWDYKDFTLKVVASFDFAYYHNIEITFYKVSFISCSTKFLSAKIRFGTDEEREWLLKNHKINYIKDEDILFCFNTNYDSDKYYIFAKGFEFNTEDVLYKNPNS
ncbi:hypothetical protein [Clostridium sp. CH2]|uniref:hypothetical protein n=1 Tax=Clostridium sp. CH2 TaxID=2949990 RepID=UPI00207A91F6|nr:hypothetical protein [Clostridium sp. CH2]